MKYGKTINAEDVVCEWVSCIEINKKAVEIDAEMIIIGSQGKSEDMKSIFFGSTAEKVLRFIKKPVLSVYRHKRDMCNALNQVD